MAKKNSSTGCEPNDHFITEAYVENTQESLTEQRFLEDLDHDDAVIGQTLFNAVLTNRSLSKRRPVVRSVVVVNESDRTGQPVVNSDKRHESSYESSPTVKRRFENTNSRLIMTVVESQQEELHRAQAEERRRQDHQLLHEQLLKQKLGSA